MNLRESTKPLKQNEQSPGEDNSQKRKFKWLTNMEKYFIWLLKKKGTFGQGAGLLPGSVLGFVFVSFKFTEMKK